MQCIWLDAIARNRRSFREPFYTLFLDNLQTCFLVTKQDKAVAPLGLGSGRIKVETASVRQERVMTTRIKNLGEDYELTTKKNT